MRSLLGFAARLYLVLTVLAGIPAGAGRAVLCVAPDGHVAIEVGQGRCADYIPSAVDAIENSGDHVTPDGCGDCVDVPMGTQVLSAARHGASAAGSQVPHASPMLVAGQATELPAVVYRSAEIHGPPTRASFPPSRTTILRN